MTRSISFSRPMTRIEFALSGSLREVAAELVEDQRAGRRTFGLSGRGTDARTRLLTLSALVAGEQLNDLLANLVEVGAQLDEDLCSNALTLADEAEQDVLGADVGVAELESLAQRVLEHLLRARGERNVAGRGLLTLADHLLDLLADCDERDVEVFERLGGEPLALVDEPQQDVLGADVIVVEHARLFLREHHDPSSTICESFEHRQSSLPVEIPRWYP